MCAQQALRGARRHEAGQGPPWQGHAELVHARGEDEPLGREDMLCAANGGGELLRPERAPHRCVADELDAQGGDLRDEVMALAHLRIDLLTTRALLEELAAGLGA